MRWPFPGPVACRTSPRGATNLEILLGSALFPGVRDRMFGTRLRHLACWPCFDCSTGKRRSPMEGLARLVAESMARCGVESALDHRRLQWSSWFRCESGCALLRVPSQPGLFALGEEVIAP